MRHDRGQIAGTGGVLLATTEQKAFVAVPVWPDRHVREPRVRRGLIFGLIRLRSSTFIGIRISSAMQVTDVSVIRRTIIPTPENRKVDGTTLVASVTAQT
jgi:hypothetical protein